MGAAFIPRALSERFHQRLQREIEARPFQRLPDQIGPVRQQADLFIITGAMAGHPAVARLRAEFVTRPPRRCTAPRACSLVAQPGLRATL